MNRSLMIAFAILAQTSAFSRAFAEPLQIISSAPEPPITADGIQALEGTDTPPFKSWTARETLNYSFNFALADRASQFRLCQGFGVGLPGRLELALSFPIGWTIGSKAPAGIDPGPRKLDGMNDDGFAPGDLKLHLLFSAFRAAEKGFGLLFGFTGGIPTGNNGKLMGEGAYFLEPLVSGSFQVFGSRIGINLAYRVRKERTVYEGTRRFEQDDDFIWRLGIRIPRRNDVAWSIEMEGMIGFMTNEGGKPSRTSRPFRFGGGLDFPIGRFYRLGMGAMFGVVGETDPAFSLMVNVLRKPQVPDEDKDGVTGFFDKCPLLKEDRDGFEDRDGCPDLDNDRDGFPDDEDKCPLDLAGQFSDDGCP